MEESFELDDIASLAAQFATNTSRHIFLTGKAGTGKTTLLKNVLSKTHKRTVIAAPTGIAAINAGGVTLHSLFQLPFGAFVPSDFSLPFDEMSQKIHTPTSLTREQRMNATKRLLLRELELLIIDEVSMLRADLLDAIDVVLRKVRRQPDLAFGGVQIIFIGDLFQLPPVVNREEMKLLSDFYSSMYFFDAIALKQDQPIYLELETVYRQDDQRFVDLLNRVRSQELTEEDEFILQERYAYDGYVPDSDGHIYLTTHNQKAQTINEERLSEVPSESKTYSAKLDGKFEPHLYPNDQELILKEGAQVMFIKNDPTGQGRFFNGKIGVVEKLKDQEIVIDCNGQSIQVERFTWENKRYKVDPSTRDIDEELIGEFSQFPIKLAWAVTVHKSQGLTFEKAVLDLENAFAPGQFYVALSRLTNLNGLIFTSSIPRSSFAIDPSLQQFNEQSVRVDHLQSQLLKDQKSYFLDLAMRGFNFNSLYQSLLELTSELNRTQSLGREDPLWEMIEGWKTSIGQWVKIGMNFGKEIFHIGSLPDETYLKNLSERLSKGSAYFLPMMIDIVDKTTEMGGKKPYQGVDEFQVIWAEWYGDLTNKALTMLRAKELVNSAATETIFNINRLQTLNEFEKLTKPYHKAKKSDTKLATLKLYQEGNSLEEICVIRQLAPGTISGHLAHYVRLGEIKAEEMIHKSKLKNIAKVIKAVQTEQLSVIKSKLGSEYSYEDIRFALAHYHFEKRKN